MQNLYTNLVGAITLDAFLPDGTKTYVCTSLAMNMRLNSVPVATVVIGCGESILTGHETDTDNNAEDLLQIVSKKVGKDTSFIECEIYENFGEGGAQCIFYGCIVSASLMYKTGSVTTRAVRLECMNLACKLYCQPFSSYSNRCAADLVDKILGVPEQTQEGEEAAATYGMYSIASLTDEELSDWMAPYLDGLDIATKISWIVDGIAMLTTRAINKADPITLSDLGTILKVGDYIGSDYKLNYDKLNMANTQTDDQFNKSLCSRLLAGVKSGSILDTIIGIITSTDYMLTLVPTWRQDDFRMKIRPSKAWDNRDPLQITFADVSDMSSTFSPLAHINDPEVFVANFMPAIEFGAPPGMTGNPESSLVGAYSTDPKMANWIKLRFSPSSIEYPLRKELAENIVKYKWREYNAPDWLITSLIVNDQADPKELTKDAIENQRQWDKENDENNKDKPLVKDFGVAERIADLVARALYTHIHGASSTASLTLLPDMRFGLGGITLEDHIGEVIDIVPKNGQDKHLSMRGMLEGIQFEYTAGMSASCRYSITLSRVRPYDSDEPYIDCPLYVSSLDK